MIGQTIVREKIKILVIDDEQEICNVLNRKLSSSGYKVFTAANGEDALATAEKENPRIVISDLKMPDIDGLHLLEKIKKMNPDTGVIIMSGHGSIESAVNAMKLGAYDFIQKPFDLDKIESLIERILEMTDLRELVTLYETSKVVFSVTKLEKLLPVLVKLSLKLLKADNAAIVLKGQDGKLYVAASNCMDDDMKKNVQLAFRQGIEESAAQIRESCIISNRLENDRQFDGIENCKKVKASIVCPLLSQSGPIGFLCACASAAENEAPFNEASQRYINIFSSQISQAIYNARFIQDLERKIEQTKKISMMGQIASSVIHDLKNVIGTTLVSAEMLLDEQFKLDKDAKECLHVAIRNATVAAGMSSKLMDIVKETPASIVIGKISDPLNDAVHLIRTKCRRQHVILKTEILEQLPYVQLDVVNLRNAFLNLFLNSLDAMPDGGKLIVKSFEDSDSKRVSVIIEDTGAGVDEDHLDKLGTPFFTTKKDGTGIGFYMTKQILEYHNANLKIENLPEKKGLKLTISFPVTAPATAEKPQPI